MKAREASGLDLGGEKGEYHTMVLDGPLYRSTLALDPASLQATELLNQVRAWLIFPFLC